MKREINSECWTPPPFFPPLATAYFEQMPKRNLSSTDRLPPPQNRPVHPYKLSLALKCISDAGLHDTSYFIS